jgi:hypothetical protein
LANGQITTGITVINSLKGFIALSLTNFSTSAASSIASGSVIEVAGAFFNFSSNETINASSWTAIATGSTVYVLVTPSGTAGSQILTASYTSTAPAWSLSNQAWYASALSNSRVVAGMYKNGTASYTEKFVVNNYDQGAIVWSV